MSGTCLERVYNAPGTRPRQDIAGGLNTALFGHNRSWNTEQAGGGGRGGGAAVNQTNGQTIAIKGRGTQALFCTPILSRLLLC